MSFNKNARLFQKLVESLQVRSDVPSNVVRAAIEGRESAIEVIQEAICSYMFGNRTVFLESEVNVIVDSIPPDDVYYCYDVLETALHRRAMELSPSLVVTVKGPFMLYTEHTDAGAVIDATIVLDGADASPKEGDKWLAQVSILRPTLESEETNVYLVDLNEMS